MDMALIGADTAANAVFKFERWDEITRVGGKDLLFIDPPENITATSAAIANVGWFIHHIVTHVN